VVVTVIVQLFIVISQSIMAFAQCSNAVLECRGVAVGIVGFFLESPWHLVSEPGLASQES